MPKTSSPCSKIFWWRRWRLRWWARERGVKRGFDLETEIELTLSEILEGAERTVEYQRLEVCDTCEGLEQHQVLLPNLHCLWGTGPGDATRAWRHVPDGRRLPAVPRSRQVDHQEVHRLSGRWQKARGEAGGSQNSGWGS